jgi:hypothetical protein
LKHTLDLRRNGVYCPELLYRGVDYIPTLETIGAAIGLCRQNEDWNNHFSTFLAGTLAQ